MVDKLPYLSDEHHYAIAAVAARAAQLDSIIEISIASLLLAVPKTSAFVLKNMNGDRYVGLLEQMLLDLIPQREAIIKAAFERVGKLRTERNEILHWIYGVSDDPALARYTSIRPHRQPQERSKTAEEIQAVANEMLDLVLVISALASLSNALCTSPYKLAQPSLLPDSIWTSILDRFQKGEPLGRLQEPSQA